MQKSSLDTKFIISQIIFFLTIFPWRMKYANFFTSNSFETRLETKDYPLLGKVYVIFCLIYQEEVPLLLKTLFIPFKLFCKYLYVYKWMVRERIYSEHETKFLFHFISFIFITLRLVIGLSLYRVVALPRTIFNES